MPDKKIEDFSALTNLSNGDYFLVSADGATYKTSYKTIMEVFKNAKNITDGDCDALIGELIFAYGNNVANKPPTASNGYFINIPHAAQPALYNKQIWFNRANIKMFVRSMEAGVFSDWTELTYGTADISLKEDKSNKITEFTDTSSPTDTQYPSAKLVYDCIAALMEADESINTNISDLTTLVRSKTAVLDTFPTTQAQLFAAYSFKPVFIYSGATSGTAIKGHVYKVTQSGTLPNLTYAVTGIGSVSDSGSGSSINVLNITDGDCNNMVGELIIAYGNNVANKPSTASNGYFVNIPHAAQPSLYNKQMWFNRANSKMFVRSMENGVFGDWVGYLDDAELKSNKIASFLDSNSEAIELNENQYPSATAVKSYVDLSIALQAISTASSYKEADKGRLLILSEIPSGAVSLASAYNKGPIFMYTGASTDAYTKGKIYEVVKSGLTYSISEV